MASPSRKLSPHKRFYPRASDRILLPKYNIKSGMIVEFPYRGSDGKGTRPLVFIMETDEFANPDKKAFHGINLNYLPIHEVERFFVRTLQKTGWEIDRHTKAAKVNLWEEEDPGLRPIVIYNNIVKPTLLPRFNCWRTYKYSNVHDIYHIRFHFQTQPLNVIYEHGVGDKVLGKIAKWKMYDILKRVNSEVKNKPPDQNIER